MSFPRPPVHVKIDLGSGKIVTASKASDVMVAKD